MKLFLTLVALSCFAAVAKATGERVICYYGTWAGYREGAGKFEPANLDATKCTHLMYTFWGLDAASGKIKTLDAWLDFSDGKDFINKCLALKKQNPNLKVMLVAGGWNEGSQKYSEMAADSRKRGAFVQSVVDTINKYNFDGFDLDWEYPAQRGGSSADVQNFVTLLKELKQALNGLELGCAVAAAETSASLSYDIPNIAKYVDFISIMTYDFAGSWDKQTGYNAPLRSSNGKDVQSSIEYWLQQGAPASKINLGLGFYGRSFTLANPAQNTPNSPSAGAGTSGPHTKESGYLGYNEICKDQQFETVWDDEAGVPYAYKDNQWVGYDNPKSIALKVDFAKSKQLGGVMVWSIETDDFRGDCGEKFPLLTAANRIFGGSSNSNSNSAMAYSRKPQLQKPQYQIPQYQSNAQILKPQRQQVAATRPVQNSQASISDICKQSDGLYPDPTDCSGFVQCAGGVGYPKKCPAGLKFNRNIKTCDWENMVKC